jgi:hypothetical protein
MERDKGEYWAVKKLLTLENYPMQDIHHKDTEITRAQRSGGSNAIQICEGRIWAGMMESVLFGETARIREE